MPWVFIFHEHAMGYALFRTARFEDWESFIIQIQGSVLNIESFRQFIGLVAFQSFANAREALEFMNNCSEGILTEKVCHFLESNIQKPKKKGKVTLLVQESKLAAVISEKLSLDCTPYKEMIEIFRGIRFHFLNLVPDVMDVIAYKTQLALGHHYARAKIKFNVNRIDNNVIQSISLIDLMEKDINTFSMRLKDWYSFHFPELIGVVPEIDLFVRCVRELKNRKNLHPNILEQLEDILNNREKAQKIIELAHISMGVDVTADDMENIIEFADRVISLISKRQNLMEYLKVKMNSVAPNLATLIGETVGARLIAHAGSLINLAKFPSSTVQVLGAEKALFRAIKSRGKTPKHGIIFHSPFIGRAAKREKGKISRYLANKCSTASRIDCFWDIPTNVFGSELKQQVEDRLQSYATGKPVAKNTDVMEKALSEAVAFSLKKAENKEKRSQSQLAEISETSVADVTEQKNVEENVVSSEKKKKRKKEYVEDYQTVESPKKRLSGDMQEVQATNVESEKQTDEKMQEAQAANVESEKQTEEEMQEAQAANVESEKQTEEEMVSAGCSTKVDIDDGTIKKKKKKKKKKKHQEE